MSKGWSGNKVREARAYWKARLISAGTLPCWRCGKHLTAEGAWTVGHLVDRAKGGSITSRDNQWPECRRCNFSAGGREGARITNARRPAAVKAMLNERDRKIRGI